MKKLFSKIKKYFKNKKTEEIRKICYTIRDYHLEKHLEKYIKTMSLKDATITARDEIIAYGITDVQENGGIVTITLTHSGLFIGRRGENIDAITEELKKIGLKEIRLIEQQTMGFLLPYYDYDYDWYDE